MSTTSEIDTVETRTDGPDVSPRVIDVSELRPGAVREYLDDSATDCYLERRAGRTYLVAR